MKQVSLISFFLFCFITFAQDKSENYVGKKVKCILSYQFKKASYYDYKINAQETDSIYTKILNINTPEGLLTQKNSNFFLNNSSEEQKEIVLYSRIFIEYNLSQYYFIKYALRDENTIHKIAVFKKDGNNWNWLERPGNDISKSILTILSLNNDAFSEFEVSETNNNYPEINRLKPLTKDVDGTLNLFKLAKVIEENKNILSKYFN
ncbi:hypothetical protein ACI76O_11505 [Capnocytophaga cynodegmi]|uniref:hypothetical protein n=1 Tax=Capnocytophaga cynodegmi TaxID=28189 RepID=UPI0038587728